jgi:hypothetical protein
MALVIGYWIGDFKRAESRSRSGRNSNVMSSCQLEHMLYVGCSQAVVIGNGGDSSDLDIRPS